MVCGKWSLNLGNAQSQELLGLLSLCPEAQDFTQNQRLSKEQNLPKLSGILRQEQINSKIDVVL